MLGNAGQALTLPDAYALEVESFCPGLINPYSIPYPVILGEKIQTILIHADSLSL